MKSGTNFIVNKKMHRKVSGRRLSVIRKHIFICNNLVDNKEKRYDFFSKSILTN